MSRPTTKNDLLTVAEEQFTKLQTLIDSLTAEQQTGTFSENVLNAGKEAHWKRDKNLRDVLVHLYEWHQLLIKWIASNTNGKIAAFLPEPYNWKTYPEMNVKFWEKHQDTPLEQAKEMLLNSHKQVMESIEKFTNDELFSKGVFKWTGTTTLGSYCVSATSSHYDWAMKKLKKHKK